MSSNLKVNTILPSTGTTIGIGTVGGLINVVGNINVNSTSGISTFNGLEISGIVTAKAGAAVTYYGDGSNLTNLPAQATIANNANNRVITGGSGVNLNGESNLTFDGSTLNNTNGGANFTKSSNNYILVGSTNASGASLVLDGDSNGDGSGTDYAYLTHNTDGDLDIVVDNPANAGNIKFFTNSSTERLRIASDGKITVAANGDIRFTNGTWSGEVAGKIQHNSNNLYIQGGTGGIRFRHASSGVNQFSMTNGGNFEITNGDVVVASGHGIDFSATGDAGGSLQTTSSELFDDYEEGSWTPVIAASAANPSFTFASGFPRGRYRKIGEQVTLWYDIAWTGLPSQGGGTLQIQNFPYATANNMYHGGGLMSHTVGTNAGGAYTGKHTHYANANSSFMYILSGASTNGHMQCTALNSSGHIFGFFTFIT